MFRDFKVILGNQHGWIPAAIAVGTALASAYASYKSQQNANEANRDSVRDQMKFQGNMSSTAHQREVEDLRKAGLNPLLSGTGGAGASTPSGASTHFTPASMGPGISGALSNAQDVLRMKKEFEATDSTVALNKAAAHTQAAQRDLNVSNAKAAAMNAEKTKTETALMNMSMPTKKAEYDLRKSKAEIDKDALKYDAVVDRVGKATGAVGNLLGVGKWFSWAKGAERFGSGTDRVIDSKTGEILQESRRRR